VHPISKNCRLTGLKQLITKVAWPLRIPFMPGIKLVESEVSNLLREEFIEIVTRYIGCLLH
jgi:hypothetical protein